MENWKKIKCLALDVDGVLTDGAIYLDSTGEWRRNFYIRDGLGMVRLKEHGYKLAIITTSLAEDIRKRAKNLEIDFFYEGAKDKASAFDDLLKKSGFKSSEIAFVGDDIIDLPVFEKCGISIAPADAHKSVKKRADVITKENGGRGAVREVCDILIAKGPL
ncbi:MAG: HAD-IIIA family hydrolase [Bdellovibrionales bacterium]